MDRMTDLLPVFGFDQTASVDSRYAPVEACRAVSKERFFVRSCIPALRAFRGLARARTDFRSNEDCIWIQALKAWVPGLNPYKGAQNLVSEALRAKVF